MTESGAWVPSKITAQHRGSVTGYFIVIPADLSPDADAISEAWSAVFFDSTYLLLFSSLASAEECLNNGDGKLHRILDGDDLLVTCRAGDLGVALDAHTDPATQEMHFVEVTRDPAKDPPVDQTGLAAVLLDEAGAVVDVLMVMRATEDDLHDAERYARDHGLALLFCENAQLVMVENQEDLRKTIQKARLS